MPPDRLTEVFARYPDALRPEPTRGLEPVPPGLSGARLWRYRSRTGQRLVVRAWPEGGPPRTHLAKIHGWLRAAGSLGYLPVPVAGLDARTVQQVDGRLWEIAPWMDGEPKVREPPDTTIVRGAFQALARFHQRLGSLSDGGPSPGMNSRVREIEQLLAGGFDALERASRASTEPEPELRAMSLEWLARARPVAPAVLSTLRDAALLSVPLQPCLRDARPEHFLFQDGRLTGLIDFGAMDVESVATDLARLGSEWFGDSVKMRQGALVAYEEVRPLDPSERALLDPFDAASRLLVGAHWLRWYFVERRCFDKPEAVRRGLIKGLARLRHREGEERTWANAARRPSR